MRCDTAEPRASEAAPAGGANFGGCKHALSPLPTVSSGGRVDSAPGPAAEPSHMKAGLWRVALHRRVAKPPSKLPSEESVDALLREVRNELGGSPA